MVGYGCKVQYNNCLENVSYGCKWLRQDYAGYGTHLLKWRMTQLFPGRCAEKIRRLNPFARSILQRSFIWGFPKIWVPPNGWFIRQNPTKMDDLGVSLFQETSIYIFCNLLLHLTLCTHVNSTFDILIGHVCSILQFVWKWFTSFCLTGSLFFPVETAIR